MEIKIGDFLKFKLQEMNGIWEIIDIEKNVNSDRFSFVVIRRKQINSTQLNILKLPFLFVKQKIICLL